jgi:hypothetical protein
MDSSPQSFLFSSCCSLSCNCCNCCALLATHLHATLVCWQSDSTRELNDMFYGLLFAYDEGLVKDDTVLASAVWRNLFHATKSTATAQVRHARTHTHTRARARTHTRARAHTHTHTRARAHTHTHTHNFTHPSLTHPTIQPLHVATRHLQDVAAMVEYIRREVRVLDDVDTKSLFERGAHTFGPPPVKSPSPPPAWLDPPATPTERDD